MPCCTGTSYIGLQVAGGSRYDAAVGQDYVNLATSASSSAAAPASCCSCWRSTTPRRSRRRRRAPSTPRRSRSGVFGLIAGLAALIIGAQSVSRLLRAAADDAGILRALGAGPTATTRGRGARRPRRRAGRGAARRDRRDRPVAVFAVRAGPAGGAPAAGSTSTPRCSALGALALVLVLGGVAVVIGYRQAPHRAAARPQPPTAARSWYGPGWARGWAPRAWPGCGSRLSRAGDGPRCRSGPCWPGRCWPSRWSRRRSRSAPASATWSPVPPCTGGTSATRCTRPTGGGRSRRLRSRRCCTGTS